MFISNIESVSSEQYKCGTLIGKYLMKMGFPLFSRVGDTLYFAKTNRLQKALNNMPFHLKIMLKAGVING